MIHVLCAMVNLYGLNISFADQTRGINYENSVLEQSLASAKYSSEFKWDSIYYTNISSLNQKICETNPDILHIACATKDGNLIFADMQKIYTVPFDYLIQILNSESGKNIKVVVLRAFYTEELAEKIVRETNVETVLYLRKTETTENCTEFLSSFYELLANGVTLSRAFHLAKYVSVSRSFDLKRKKKNSALLTFINNPQSEKEILVFASSPTDKKETILQDLAIEIDYIKSFFPPSDIHVEYPRNRRQIVMSIACHRPKILHFSSHANQYMIAFYDEKGSIYELEKYWLLNVIKEFRQDLECLVLNSCINAPIAYRLSEYIPYVIGTKTSVMSAAATDFSAVFYKTYKKYSDYREAFFESFYWISRKYFGYRNKEFCLFEKEHYRPSYFDIQDDQKLMVKEEFLNRYGAIDEEWIHHFRSVFELWYKQFEGNPMIQRQVLNFLRLFQYYSKDSVTDIMKKLFSSFQTDASNVEYTIYLPLPSQKPRRNSSYTYWDMLFWLSGLSRHYFQTDLHNIGDKLNVIQNIVFLDDMLGSGQTFCDYLIQEQTSLKGKNIYYLVIHSMEEGIRNIRKKAKELSLSVTIISYKVSKKAFQQYRVKKHAKNQFKEFCLQYKMDAKDIFGYSDSESLCGFFNSMPNNNLGVFVTKTDHFLPLFHQKKAPKPAWMSRDLLSIPDEQENQNYILNYLQQNNGNMDWQELCEMLDLSESTLNDMIKKMVDCNLLQICDGKILPAQNRKIIVLGGSFNPPTLAHESILKNAIQQLHADYGMLVPSSNAYVLKKIKKNGEITPPLSESLRLSMLQAVCENNPNFLIGRYELGGDEKGHSYETMCQIQADNPNAQLIFLIGADKLEKFRKWRNVKDFLEKFYIAVVKRGEKDPLAYICEDSILAPYKDRFLFIESVTEDSEVSSSKARKSILRGKDLDSMLSKQVLEILQTNPEIISRFREDYYFLSNFYESEIKYDGRVYRNAEAAFQAQKCRTDSEKVLFRYLSGKEAKKVGRIISLREDWEYIKLSVMYDIVFAKFHQNEELMEKLKNTNSAYLIEGNDWNDQFWGFDVESETGNNHLGMILMMVRNTLL